ncbi:hypothetical protein AGMMS49975_01880 [Clostridia bacterium]|nr:hypothetical protein AGMMS49975_01880 [Clostridia bacterium]
MDILFVCTGNTCRSPMAAAAARKIFAEKELDFVVLSAGTDGADGNPASVNAVEAAKERELDLSAHKSQRLSEKLLHSGIIITMTEGHRRQILQTRVNTNVYTFEEEIPDPFGGSLEVYTECLDKLYISIEKLADKLKNFVPPLVLGSDHGGYELKQELINHLTEQNVPYIDLGTYSNDSVDYPDYADKVCSYILEGKAVRGVLVCGTGVGISIAANRHRGIRAALCGDVYSARLTREHNDANVLCLGGRVLGAGLAAEILDTFLAAEFSNEDKHLRRLGQIG